MESYKVIIDYSHGLVGKGKFEYRVDRKTYNKVYRSMGMMDDFEVEGKYFDFKFVKKIDFINCPGLAISKETLFNQAYFS